MKSRVTQKRRTSGKGHAVSQGQASSRSRAVLIGPVPFSRALLRRFSVHSRRDLVIAVDRGVLQCLRHGIRPDFAVGDWDSMGSRHAALKRIRHLSLAQEKDRSDLYYAAGLAAEAGAGEILCLGVTGGRLDHHLAMLYDLSTVGSLGPQVLAAGDEGTYAFVSAANSPLRLRGVRRGQVISVLPLSGPARGVELKGFKYRVKDGKLSCSSHGLSNVALGARASVGVGRGSLVVIVPSAKTPRM